VSRATVYRTLRRLADHDLVHQSGETWALAPRALEGLGNSLLEPARRRRSSAADQPGRLDQQFLRGMSDNSPSINSRTRRRGSTRANRPAIRDLRPSNASCRRAGSTPRPAATTRSLVFIHR
jgi:hypothetical protein